MLKGKRASKLRPDFIIFDPKIKSSSSSGKGESPLPSLTSAVLWSLLCQWLQNSHDRIHKVLAICLMDLGNFEVLVIEELVYSN